MSNSKGGAHIFFWGEFKKLIELLLTELGNKPAIYQSLVLSLSDLNENLTMEGNSSGNWLSSIRNDVTYRHEYGVWYPHTKFIRGDNYSVFKNIRLDMDPLCINLNGNHSKLYKFSSIVNYIVVLMIEINSELIERNSLNKSFLNKNFGILLKRLYRFLNSN